MKHKAGLIIIFFAMIFGYGCEGEKVDEISLAPAQEETLASVNVRINTDAQSSSANFNALGTTSEITTITVDVQNAADDASIASAALENTNGIWTGTLSELPYDISINFIANALDADGVLIFSGTITKTLVVGADNDIAISLSSIDDGVQPDNPVIVSVSMPQKILVDSDPQQLLLKIDHNANVAYSIEVSSGNIASAFDDEPVSSLTGVHDPAGELEFFYSAPSAPGVTELTISIKDLNSSDTVGASYFINVVSFDPDSWTDSGVDVVFGPAITDLSLERSVNTLRLTLSTDPESGLVYEWQGTGDFSDLNTSGNPIFITDFNDTMTGEISVTVRDENNLTAFSTRTILAGDYPYTVNDYIVDMPGIYIYDETTQLMWQDNTNKISQKWSKANSFCQDLNLVDYLVWRLPTENELVNMFARKDDLSNFYTQEYWTADEDPDDTGRALTVSFDDGDVASQSKTRRKLVRCVKD